MSRLTVLSWLLGTLSPIYLSLSITPVSAQSPKQSCDPIGRILQGQSQNYTSGDTICNGTEISAPVNLQFLCFQDAQTIQLTETVVIDTNICEDNYTAVQNCPAHSASQLLCFKPKGAIEQFSVIEPDTISHNVRPEISWEEVPNSTAYTVHVEGIDIRWSRTVTPNETRLAYPAKESSLTIGNAYEVLVTAHGNTTENEERVTATASRVINIQDSPAAITLQLIGRVPSRMGD